jgi:hypothetical protein
MVILNKLDEAIKNKEIYESFDNSFVILDKDMIVKYGNSLFFDTFKKKKKDVENNCTCEEVCGNNYCGTKDCTASKALRTKKVPKILLYI